MPTTVFLHDVRLALLVLLLLAVPWAVPASLNAVVPRHTVAAGQEEVRVGQGAARFQVPQGFERVLGTNRDSRTYERGAQRIAVRIVGGVRDPDAGAERYISNRMDNARIDAPLLGARYQGYRCSMHEEAIGAGKCTVITHQDYLVAITSTSTDATQPVAIEELLRELTVEVT